MIRPLLSNEKEIVSSLFKSTFDVSEEPYFEPVWAEHSPSSVGLFSNRGELRGFVLVVGNEIKYICVAKRYQCRGYGSELLHEAIKKTLHGVIRSIYLVPVNDEKVIQWYKKRGFVITSERENPKRILMVYSDYNTRSRSV
jgi:ribosomal protein S18 acetylase RimI-like enzyme